MYRGICHPRPVAQPGENHPAPVLRDRRAADPPWSRESGAAGMRVALSSKKRIDAAYHNDLGE
jgi:hypothetical protein